MFQRIKNLFRRRRSLSNFPALRDEQRAIFRYWDGVRETGCDPVAALIEMETDEEFRQDQHPQLVDEGDADATQVMARMIGRVFRLPEFSPAGGLTITERLALYTTFCDYAAALKKNGDPTLTPPPATAATSSD